MKSLAESLLPEQPNRALDNLLGLVALAAVAGVMLGLALSMTAMYANASIEAQKTGYGIAAITLWASLPIGFMVVRHMWRKVVVTIH